MFRQTALAALTAAGLTCAGLGAAWAEPVAYTFDKSHANIGFTVSHLGFSNVHGRFGSFDGTLMIDEETPANSSVTITIPAASLNTFWDARNEHLKGADFFNVAEYPDITFKSTKVEKTGDNTLDITGDLTFHGTTKPVTLKTTVNQFGAHPMSGKKTIGVAATTVVKRSDFGMGAMAPAIGDNIPVTIDFEASVSE